MKIGVVTVPYITTDLHYQFAFETLQSIHSVNHALIHIGIVNQWREEDKLRKRNSIKTKYDVLEENDRNSLSRAWNKGIKKALDMGCDYALVPNLDVIFSRNTVDNLVAFAQQHPEAIMWTSSETKNKLDIDAEMNEGFDDNSPHFSCFMIDKRLFERVGRFDENFSAYMEDNDMHYRIKLAGEKALRTATSMFYHYGSRTIKASDDPHRAEMQLGSGKSRPYYIRKWGGGPGQEIFKRPYNHVSLTVKDWYEQD